MSIANETVHFRELHVCVVMASPLKQFNKSFLISQVILKLQFIDKNNFGNFF